MGFQLLLLSKPIVNEHDLQDQPTQQISKDIRRWFIRHLHQKPVCNYFSCMQFKFSWIFWSHKLFNTLGSTLY